MALVKCTDVGTQLSLGIKLLDMIPDNIKQLLWMGKPLEKIVKSLFGIKL